MSTGRLGRPHGYIFEVDRSRTVRLSTSPEEAGPVPRTRPGGRPGHRRRLHDRGRGARRVLSLRAGGLRRPHVGPAIQMLRIKGKPGYNTIVGQSGRGRAVCNWVNIDDAGAVEHRGPRYGRLSTRAVQGRSEVPGRRRLHLPQRWLVFDSSDGGDDGLGQIWEYTPKEHRRGRRGRRARPPLRIHGQAPAPDGPDNMCTSPGGAIVVVEDGNLISATSSEASCPTVRCSRWRRT